ncbi:hypothetical protein [Roseomonas sp. KE2513]|nr:hypothetical protein [Roseomonas sp. KE2513]
MIDEHCLNVRLGDYLGRYSGAPPNGTEHEERADSADTSLDEDTERR